MGAVSGNVLELTDRNFPAPMFTSGPVNVSYIVYGVGEGGVSTHTRSTESNNVQVTMPAPVATGGTGGGTGTSGSTAPRQCKLTYFRADNAWAAAGRPDGFLGEETLTLNPTGYRVFITDWEYEKRRNDGTSYYGSHVRVVENRGQLKLFLKLRSGLETIHLTLEPGRANRELRADLMEVRCAGT